MTSKTFTISGKTSELKHSLQNTLYLENGNYGLALISLDMFYSVPNITKKNNKFKYSLDSGVSWNTITLNKGFYTLDLLYNEIIFILIMSIFYCKFGWIWVELGGIRAIWECKFLN